MADSSGEKIVQEDEEPMIPAEEESQKLTTMIVGDTVPEIEEFPIEHIEISFTVEEPLITIPDERIEHKKKEIISTINVTKQVEFGIFNVASHHEESKRDC